MPNLFLDQVLQGNILLCWKIVQKKLHDRSKQVLCPNLDDRQSRLKRSPKDMFLDDQVFHQFTLI